MKLFDLHCDTLLTGADLAANQLSVNLDDLSPATSYAQCYAIFLRDGLDNHAAQQHFAECHQHYCRQMTLFASRIQHCRNIKQAQKAWQNHKAGAFLTIENAGPLITEAACIEKLARFGIKALTLTWNGPNQLAGGIASEQSLTPLGRAVIRKMEKLNLILDVSHLNDRSFWQVAAYSKRPFMASHSNSRSICQHPRNLTDQQIQFIAKQNGICGLNFYVAMLSKDRQVLRYDTLLRHIGHFLCLAGEDTLALGSDFDGCTPPTFLSSLKDTQSFYDYLCRFGYGKALADKLFYKNAMNFFQKFDTDSHAAASQKKS